MRHDHGLLDGLVPAAGEQIYDGDGREREEGVHLDADAERVGRGPEGPLALLPAVYGGEEEEDGERVVEEAEEVDAVQAL